MLFDAVSFRVRAREGRHQRWMDRGSTQDGGANQFEFLQASDEFKDSNRENFKILNDFFSTLTSSVKNRVR